MTPSDPTAATDDRSRTLARLDVLQRLRQELERHDRPAMLHSIDQLIKLESGALRALEQRPSQPA